MNDDSPISRRNFVIRTALIGATAALGAPALRAEEPKKRFQVIGFTKPFQDIGFDETADYVAKIGWTGIECAVRAKGQVLPERVEDDLPRLQEALRKRNVDLTLLTTDIRRVDPLAERVLRMAAKLGVRRYRFGFVHYDLKKPVAPQLDAFKAELRDLAALNRELGVVGALQNHSGPDLIGAPVWDIYELIHDLDPAHLGACFDIGHATVEGGLSWPIQARLLEPYFVCPYVKDFVWKQKPGANAWTVEWCPLGQGMIRPEYFTWLRNSTYSGPVSQHFEYVEGAGPKQLEIMQRDCAKLRELLGIA